MAAGATGEGDACGVGDASTAAGAAAGAGVADAAEPLSAMTFIAFASFFCSAVAARRAVFSAFVTFGFGFARFGRTSAFSAVTFSRITSLSVMRPSPLATA